MCVFVYSDYIEISHHWTQNSLQGPHSNINPSSWFLLYCFLSVLRHLYNNYILPEIEHWLCMREDMKRRGKNFSSRAVYMWTSWCRCLLPSQHSFSTVSLILFLLISWTEPVSKCKTHLLELTFLWGLVRKFSTYWLCFCLLARNIDHQSLLIYWQHCLPVVIVKPYVLYK